MAYLPKEHLEQRQQPEPSTHASVEHVRNMRAYRLALSLGQAAVSKWQSSGNAKSARKYKMASFYEGASSARGEDAFAALRIAILDAIDNGVRFTRDDIGTLYDDVVDPIAGGGVRNREVRVLLEYLRDGKLLASVSD